MFQPIHNREPSQLLSETSAIPGNRNNTEVKKAALATIAGLAFIGVVTTLALAITFSMPALAAAVVACSIIAVACCILLNKELVASSSLPQETFPERGSELSIPDLSPPLSFQSEDLSTPEYTPPPSPTFQDPQDIPPSSTFPAPQDIPLPQTSQEPQDIPPSSTFQEPQDVPPSSTFPAPQDVPLPQTFQEPQDVPSSPTPPPQVLPAAAAAPLQTVPNFTELLDGLTKLASRQDIQTPQFDPIDQNTTFSGWQVPHTETVLVSTCGDITTPRFLTKDLTPMLVNAANDTMYRHGGGTNYVFTRAVSRRGWQNSTEGKARLNIGECTAGKWINANGTTNDGDSSAPALLAQLLGPTANQLNNDALRCYETVTKAYENCLAKAVEKGAKYVQLPLISSSLFAPPANLAGGTVRAEWIDAVKAALVTAVTNFATQNPNSQMIIVVTDIANPPLG
ncbi:macro domain-containing protein [Chlamydia psittaci]|uniref:macro domain-containing protein n=1 Tax=Chlamydia psittaci TaxID=83554 RepID=UPI0001F36798|nr:macro domain-containing protein [Chlamydia psittaci]AFS19465.1 ATPase associated with chromosome architecture [Chlamydia psittaci 84/55]EPJ16781.1 macro domain protein [Chlamydia psittaci 02DC22]EPJ18870.1 macro domain protein [Chlamydia psittaci 01DC11]EPJ20119.1 macro domain protein [Chlamydia psittaci 02DC21]EPJ23234.1 macro domain protein [Chlamydia psittaci 03DC29]EPJ24436.1 macro domain protein [Chlamydia psittaci 08DC60]